ncbi:hypothetical protein BDA96_02G048600 [Sorghum bicolor]|uniref:Uncharacterized protein n=1 Tax=Sorghum bicolor TaxID=4558 RepID=A0A921URF4_SORBI|nr:hypothetical protein BDA96_02G048600 [Sorghum bicolor]
MLKCHERKFNWERKTLFIRLTMNRTFCYLIRLSLSAESTSHSAVFFSHNKLVLSIIAYQPNEQGDYDLDARSSTGNYLKSVFLIICKAVTRACLRPGLAFTCKAVTRACPN